VAEPTASNASNETRFIEFLRRQNETGAGEPAPGTIGVR
jgi:hypothetical protein